MNINRVILFLGPPGSGKGTLAQKCVQDLGWDSISTGDLCRKHIANQTEIGQAIDFAIKSGKLVSDELISQMVFDWFQNQKNGSQNIILDGFPRTVNQARVFDQLIKQWPNTPRITIAHFVIDDQVVIDRLENRYVCANKSCQRVYSLNASAEGLAPQETMRCDSCGDQLIKRKDDTAEAIKERLKNYYQHEKDLLSYYKDTGYEVVTLKSELPIDQLFMHFKEKMEE